MTLDIEKIKAAAMADTEDELQWSSTGILELINRLEAAEKAAAKWHEYQAKKKVLADRGFGKSPMRDVKESEK